MKLNCKPGDLAVVVRSACGNEGKIVGCIRLATEAEIAQWDHDASEGPVWLLNVDLPRSAEGWGVGWYAPLAKDRNLRPIRPNDGKDETLTWKDVPTTEKVSA
jgi:hypothetical protein